MASAPQPTKQVDQLVVVGASAGGIEALSVLVGSLPENLAVPIVIAQHLDPKRPSHLAEILSRHTVLPVKSVLNSEKLLPGTIYVVPSNHHVEITDHEVSVYSDVTRRPTPSVDLLLATAAGIFGERLVAVILTGSGSDGAAGAHVVKEAGGTVLIQDPATAAFPSMPQALASALVDAALPLEEIGRYLGDIFADTPENDQEADPDLSALLTYVHESRGIDFSAYKPGTISRRLRRRMLAAKESTTAGYLAYLKSHPQEEEQLVADFLIKVTRFFRDPALFARLREQVLPDLLDQAVANGHELRMWSAGCATGEEAYSLALLVNDLLENLTTKPTVRIFATDLDDSALAFARLGVYPKTALVDVPADLVARHFRERDGAYEANKDLRSLLVFGRHDLAERPPFPNTDLVLCRNVLIYFTPRLQQRALDIFEYSLRNGGYLVLGKSESSRPGNSSFTVFDQNQRIFRRAGPRPALPSTQLHRKLQLESRPHSSFQRSPASLELALREAEKETRTALDSNDRSEDLLRRLPIGVVIVDSRYDIASINGMARELLGIYGLAEGQDLIHLAQRIPSSALRSAIDSVIRGVESERLADVVTVETATGEERHLSVSCYPDRRTMDGSVETALVLVDDVTTLVRTKKEGDRSVERENRLTESNRQLLTANRELNNALDLMRDQLEDLRLVTATAQVSAEEIETLNEELQSTNEELETLHEEAQASLEELNIANDELQARGLESEALAATHAAERGRLAGVLTSMADAVVVVDRTGRAIRTNAAYDQLREEVGDRFVRADESGGLVPEDTDVLLRAARGEKFRIDFEVESEENVSRWFEATAQPLRDDDVGTGVVVIRDITDRSVRRMQAEFLDWAGHELRTPLTALQSYLQLAARRIPADGDERLRSYIDRAVGQVKRQASLISELLDATRLETGRLALHIAPLDLVSLVEHAVEVAQVLTQGQTILFERDEEPLIVEGDVSRLEQVLLNLLTNAISYAPDTEQIDVTVRREASDGVVTVRDYGRGIDIDQHDLIFERLAQGEPNDRASTQGLGLGLYIAREIVRHHGGTITVQSRKGKGATFVIRIPLQQLDS